MATYLAYGSNLWPPRLAARVGACTATASVALPGWSLVFDKLGADGSGKCALVADATGCAHGVLYRLPEAAWTALDRIEGRGRGYERETLTLPDHGPCDVYLAQPGARRPALRPFDWYLRIVFAGAAHHGFLRLISPPSPRCPCRPTSISRARHGNSPS